MTSIIKIKTIGNNIDITGLQAGIDGQRITILNVDTGDILLKKFNNGSIITNRFGDNNDARIKEFSGIDIIYDTVSGTWLILSL